MMAVPSGFPDSWSKPYVARHSSVSWNLMIGRNPLWVAKQHGHSLVTMLTVYAAWVEGTLESDVVAIRRAMRTRPAATSSGAREDRIMNTSHRRVRSRYLRARRPGSDGVHNGPLPVAKPH